MLEFLDSIDYGVMFHEIPANLACAYLKGHLIGKVRDWFQIIGSSYVTGTATDFAQLKQALGNSFPVARNRERDEGVVETDGLNGEKSWAEQVENEGSKGLAREESSNKEKWQIKRMMSEGSTESCNDREGRHQSERRLPVRMNGRKCPGIRKMTSREAADESGVLSGRSSPGPPRGASDKSCLGEEQRKKGSLYRHHCACLRKGLQKRACDERDSQQFSIFRA
ncbi:hypothetical protein NPIL_583671 [Nephila pilipes]|uniref:Uncharacterized protein n=1 Tax=Nephila pilipes TaxID=299642 RepID=A0A8X6N3L6_NEPPI|nr:hypothetical protein NPIL_583671 [Nephila pilipes]